MTYVLPIHVILVFLWVSVVVPTVRAGGFSDSLICFWDPFSSTRLPHPVLLRGVVPSFIITFDAIFGCYPWKACEEEWNLRKEDAEGRDWEKIRRGNSGQDAIQERKIK